MRLGISSYAYPWAAGVSGYPLPPSPLTPEGLLDIAGELDVHVVQFADNLPLEALPENRLAAFIRKAKALAIDIEYGTRGFGIDLLRNSLALARRLESPLLRVVVDRGSDHPSAEEIVLRLRCVLPEFERANVRLAIENHDRFKARTLRAILDAAESNFAGLCFDTANSFGSSEGPEAVLDTVGDRVINLHVKDYTVRRMPEMFGFLLEGCPAGQGQLDIPALLDRVRLACPDANAILENWPAPESTVEESMRKEHEWTRSGVTYLRQYLAD